LLLKPSGFLVLKPRPRDFSGHPEPLVQLSETEPDLLVNSVPAFMEKRLIVMEQLHGSFHKLFDASVSAARHVFLNQRFVLGLETNSHKRSVGGPWPV